MGDEEGKVLQKLDRKMNRTGTIIILALLSLVILGFGVQALEAGACERAFVNCMDEPIQRGNMLWIVYCGNGYAFCLKYID